MQAHAWRTHRREVRRVRNGREECGRRTRGRHSRHGGFAELGSDRQPNARARDSRSAAQLARSGSAAAAATELRSKPMRTMPFSIEPFSHAAMKGAR
jgi:hypothetical protein